MSVGPGNFDVLPPDPGVISPDLALDAALAPVIDYAEPPVIPYGKGWQFDFLAGQFVRHGTFPAEAHDVNNLAVWVEKTLRTARYAHVIYSDAYGKEEPFEPIGFPLAQDEIALYQERVIDALQVHDRIADVQDFSFSQAPYDDSLYVSFTIVLDDDQQLSAGTIEFTDVLVAGGAG